MGISVAAELVFRARALESCAGLRFLTDALRE
jgi:hypothetical protein